MPNDSDKGLYLKYQVRHADGSALSPGPVFVLRPDRDNAAWAALKTYAKLTENAQLASDLLDWLAEHPLEPETQTCPVCEETMTKTALLCDGHWELSWWCENECDLTGKMEPIDWPFAGDEATPEQLQAVGFYVVFL
jgi:hypothetical protein